MSPVPGSTVEKPKYSGDNVACDSLAAKNQITQDDRRRVQHRDPLGGASPGPRNVGQDVGGAILGWCGMSAEWRGRSRAKTAARPWFQRVAPG